MSSNNRDSLICCIDDLDAEIELDQTHENRPGLPTLSYRLGHHGDFFKRMLSRMPNQRVPGSDAAPLGRLTYRGEDDATIALIDACSSLLEVLSFYQERIVNEGFIRTAIERRSVLELARSIGYEMRPGVAASTLLTFTVDDSPGSPEQVLVPVGTQVLSIPKKDELPQTFETIEPLDARVEWNVIDARAPSLTLEQTIRGDSEEFFVSRSGPRLRRGDVVLLTGEAGETVGTVVQGSELRYVRRVHDVIDYPGRGYRRVVLQPVTADPVSLVAPRLFAFGLRTTLFGQNAPNPDGRTIVVRRVFASPIQTAVLCVALSPDGTRAASGFTKLTPDPDPDVPEPERLTNTVRIWDVASGREERALNIDETITAVSFSSDNTYIVTATHAGTTIGLKVWVAATAQLVTSASLSSTTGTIVQDGPIEALVFHAESGSLYRITAINANNKAVVWEFDKTAKSLIPKYELDLAPLGNFAGDPRELREENLGLIGDDSGLTWYQSQEVLDQVPDTIEIVDGEVDLNGIYNKLVPGGWLLLLQPDQQAGYRINSVTNQYRSDYGISKRVTRLVLEPDSDGVFPSASLRETEIYGESDEIMFATLDVALPLPIQGDVIPVVEDVGLPAGRTVIVQGRAIESIPLFDEKAPAASNAVEEFDITAMDADGNPQSFKLKGPINGPWTITDEHGFAGELDPGVRALAIWDDDADIVYEVAKVAVDDPSTAVAKPRLRFAEPLQNKYDWRTVKVFANIAPATHGETVSEVLGSGDGLARNQRFKIKSPPLTHITGMTGLETTLQVWVNNVRWQQYDSLLEVTPRDESYIVRIEDDGTTIIAFGDGERGARLPSGSENVVANYRHGLGPEGEVEAGQLALLKTKPLGIREVTNALPATGAAPPEQESETRVNAPLTVLVLGRVVSIQDYEDFSKTYPGIGKAQAVPMWDEYSRFVHLTIGTAGGDPIEDGSPLYESLRSVLDMVRDTHQKMVIEGYVKKNFGLSAKILIDERYLPEPVLDAVHERLVTDFSYDARDLGQAVTASEVVASIHRIDGVVAVDLDSLFFAGPGEGPGDQDGSTAPLQYLPAHVAYRDAAGVLHGAELLLVDRTQITLEVMS